MRGAHWTTDVPKRSATLTPHRLPRSEREHGGRDVRLGTLGGATGGRNDGRPPRRDRDSRAALCHPEPCPPEHVYRLVAFLEGRVGEIQGDRLAQDPQKLLALAALDIADELFRLRSERAQNEGDTTARVGALVRLLDAMVDPDSVPPKRSQTA